MFEELNKLARCLQDSDAGWVNRRDAAQKLGDVASAALGALQKHAAEMDLDVRRVIDKVLEDASAALAGIEPARHLKEFSLKDLAEACAKGDERIVEKHEDGYAVKAQLKNGRHQVVYLDNHKRKDGIELIRVFSKCGPAKEEALAWALQANMKISHGALAMSKSDGEDFLVMTNCYIAKLATPSEIKASVKEMAQYGDWIENKLTGLDEF